MDTKSNVNTRPRVLITCRAIVCNPEGAILLIKRAKTDSYMPGKWEFPGGKLDSGQDIPDALKREVKEETGLNIESNQKSAYWHSKIVTDGKYKGMLYLGLIVVADIVSGKLKLSEEHDDFVWVSQDEFYECDLVPETREAMLVLNGDLE